MPIASHPTDLQKDSFSKTIRNYEKILKTSSLTRKQQKEIVDELKVRPARIILTREHKSKYLYVTRPKLKDIITIEFNKFSTIVCEVKNTTFFDATPRRKRKQK